MIKFYYHPSPNPAKVALFLEEAGLEYELMPVDTRKGEQHSPSYRAINPNGKTPSIVDGEATIFDSSAILLYLAEKTGRFLPEKTPKARGELLSWLFFVSSGVGPFSGQAFHFNAAAPEKIEYAINRYVSLRRVELPRRDDGVDFPLDRPDADLSGLGDLLKAIARREEVKRGFTKGGLR